MPRLRCSAVILLFVLSIPPAIQAGQPFRYPEGKHAKGQLKYVGGLPVLTVEGTPEEIGEQIGILAVKPAATGRLFNYPKEILERFHLTWSWPLFVHAGNTMFQQFPADYQRELQAVVKASGMDRDLAIVANTMFDVKKIAACSTLVVEASRSKTGNLLFGRNLDFPTLGYLQEYTLVIVYRPKGKHPFVSVGFPGMIGALSGMNDEGLSLAILETFWPEDAADRFDAHGVPYALCYRQLLEECTTVDQARERLRKMRRASMTNLAIADRKRAAVFEVTPRVVLERPATDGFCACTNHYFSESLAPPADHNPFQSRERLQSLEKYQAKQRLGIEDIHKSLHDANQEDHTLQTMIFEPATLRLHLASGQTPSSALPLELLEVGPLLRVEVPKSEVRDVIRVPATSCKRLRIFRR